MAADSEQQRYMESLDRRIRSGRWRGVWLAGATAAAVLASLTFWSIHYMATVFRYAQVDPSLSLERSGADPDRLVFLYRPLSGGVVTFRLAEADRETELLDEVTSDSVGVEQEFQWRRSGVETGSVVRATFREGWSLVTRELIVPAAGPPPVLGHAVLTGQVVDATSNEPVAGAEVRLVGTPLVARTGPDGRFHLAGAPAGPAGIEVSADKFSTEQWDTELVLGQETAVRPVLSPGLKQGQVRLVLTWNAAPGDLDAHLEGPRPDSERFHVYFRRKGDLKSREFVSLDVDARQGHGPETITVLGVHPGTYHFFVHDYSNRDDGENLRLSHSGAEVRVYQGGQARRFRANNESVGNIWHVCDIEVHQGGATVKKVDRYEVKPMPKVKPGTVVLMIDTSLSMRDLIGTAKQAANDFLAAVPFEDGARAGLVTFGHTTGKVHDITGDREALRQAVADLQVGNGTPMAEGLRTVHQMLAHVEGPCSVVVFTDGEPDEPQAAAKAGEIAKQDKITIWAIGTAGANKKWLQHLTSTPDKTFFASEDRLRQIFDATAGKIYGEDERMTEAVATMIARDKHPPAKPEPPEPVAPPELTVAENAAPAAPAEPAKPQPMPPATLPPVSVAEVPRQPPPEQDEEELRRLEEKLERECLAAEERQQLAKSPERLARAVEAMRAARALYDAGQEEEANSALIRLKATFSGTPAAEEAKRLLSQIRAEKQRVLNEEIEQRRAANREAERQRVAETQRRMEAQRRQREREQQELALREEARRAERGRRSVEAMREMNEELARRRQANREAERQQAAELRQRMEVQRRERERREAEQARQKPAAKVARKPTPREAAPRVTLPVRPGPTPAEESLAAARLRQARARRTAGDEEQAKRACMAIIREYPETRAADDARQLARELIAAERRGAEIEAEQARQRALEAREQPAQKALDQAKRTHAAGQTEEARKQFLAIVARYAGTRAAAEASRLENQEAAKARAQRFAAEKAAREQAAKEAADRKAAAELAHKKAAEEARRRHEEEVRQRELEAAERARQRAAKEKQKQTP